MSQMKYVDLAIMRSLYSLMEVPHNAKVLFQTDVIISLIDL